MNAEVRDAFADWLNGWEWSYFYTVTFRWPRQPHHSDSTINEIKRVLLARCGVRRFFLGTELHINRTLHVHGLLGLQGRYSGAVASHVFRESYERWGRSEVLPVRAREAATLYVSKYVSKELTAWWLQV